jgi:hypothetical protein
LQSHNSVYFIFILLCRKLEDKRFWTKW